MYNHFMPTVTTSEGRVERTYDLYSRLLKDRIILVPDVDQNSANLIIAQLLYLLSEDDKRSIKMYINSPGGSILDGDGILDTMDHVKAQGVVIETIVTGKACSFGSLILANGTKGHRFVFPRSRVMIHQPLGGAKGQASDIEREAILIGKMKHEITEFLSEKTGQTYEQIKKDTDRDTWFRGQEVVEYGLADRTINFDATNE